MNEKLKLIKYNRKNTKMRQDKEPTIRFHVNGGINLSKVCMEKTGLQVGDRIEFLQDEKDKAAWYIGKSFDGEGFEIREMNKKSSSVHYQVNSAYLAKAVIKSLNLDARSVGFKVSSNPIQHGGKELFFIITSEPYIKTVKS